MQTTNAINKLEKAGFSIVSNGNRYQARLGRSVIGFYNQDDKINCINVRDMCDVDDAQSDYSAGVFCDNLTQAIKLAH
jgi:hypothetical protein